MNDFTPDNCPFIEGTNTCKLTECSKNIMGMCTKKGSKNYPDVPHRTNFEKLKLMNIDEFAKQMAVNEFNTLVQFCKFMNIQYDKEQLIVLLPERTAEWKKLLESEVEE